MTKRRKMILTVPPNKQHPLRVRMPGTEYPFWERLPIGGGSEVSVIALAQRVVTYRCHYVSESYLPCLLDYEAECPYHDGPANPRTIFQGSLPVARLGGGKVYLVNPTARCLRMGSPALQDQDDLLGRMLTFGRKVGGRNAPMYWHDPKQKALDLRGKGFSPDEVWRTQLNIWGVELRAAGSLLSALEQAAGEGDSVSSSPESNAGPRPPVE